MKKFLSYFKSKEAEAAKLKESAPAKKAIPERVARAIEAYRNKSKNA